MMEQYNYYFGDFNGDGRTDMLATEIPQVNYDITWYLYLANPSGSSFTNVATGSLPNSGIEKFNGFYQGDFNGDGKTDLLMQKIKLNVTQTGDHRYRWDVWESTGDDFDSKPLMHNSNYYEILYEDYIIGEDIFLDIGDFDGDRKSDLVIYNKITQHYYIEQLNRNSNVYDMECWYDYENVGIIDFNDHYFSEDFNGDGKTDIMIINGAMCWINEIVDDGTNPPEAVNMYASGYPTEWHRVYPGDFNGDGITDVLTYGSGAGWEIRLFNGKDGFNTPWFSTPSLHDPVEGGYLYYIGDYNGDGASDINEVQWDPDNPCYSKIYFKGSSDYSTSLIELGTDINIIFSKIYPNLDFNGDGKEEMFCSHIQTYWPISILKIQHDEKKHLVNSIVDGYDQKTEFEYNFLSKSNNTPGEFYIKGDEGYPYYNYSPLADFQGPLSVVTDMYIPDGVGDSQRINYYYEGAKVHNHGKGFIGFEKITSMNYYQNKKQITTNEIKKVIGSNTYYVCLPDLIENKTYYDQPLKTIDNDYGIRELGDKRIFTYLNTSIETDHITNTTVNMAETTYDDYGNLEYKRTLFGNDGTTEVTIEYDAAGAWCLSKPDKITTTMSRPGETSYTRIVEHNYDSNNGNLNYTVTDPGKTKAVTTDYTYNDCGLVLTETVSANGLASRSKSFQYDDRSRFPTRITNALGNYSEMEYDPATGSLLSATDIDGHTTTNEYDAFNRITKVTTPLGHSVNTSYNWYTAGQLDNAVYYTGITGENAPDIKLYYDAFSREIQAETEGYNGTVFAETKYNSKGQLWKKSDPYYSGETKKWTEYFYEGMTGRIDQIEYQGLTTSYDYSGTSTTITDPAGHSSSKTLDATGTVISATDDGGTITYDHYSSGNIKSITANGSMVEFMYDEYGRQTSLSDPDAGICSYDYNAYGELVSQTDANNNNYTMTYDILGRIETKDGPEGITYYNYVTSGNGKEQLSSVTGPNGVTQSYSYNEYGRVTEYTENVQGQVFTETYEYDEYGNLIETMWPSDFGTVNSYNDNGYLTDIRRSDNNDLIWQANDINASGQVTESMRGYGIYTNYEYDNTYGFLHRITTGNVFNMEFNFDPYTGNLMNRQDDKLGLTETFTYDDDNKGLNRLTSWQVTGEDLYSMTYNDNGNIQSKTDIGNYTYDPVKVHAVTKVSNTEDLISHEDQDITYTGFNKVATLIEKDGEVYQYKLEFTYGPGQQRVMTKFYEYGSLQKTKYFFGSYEKTIEGSNTKEVYYISAPGGLVAVYIKEGTNGNMYYTCQDHLGSIVKLLNASGQEVESYSYDAWGNRRDPSDWDYTSVPVPVYLDRGFTGHEHLDEFGLINMNGRIYDPLIGRFLSPDNYIQMPDFTQNLNRYSYCLNNPLVYTDPDGEILGTIFTFFWDLGTTIFTKGGIDPWNTPENRREAWSNFDPTAEWSKTNKAWKIDKGLYITDPNRSDLGRVLQFISRFTWELPQTIVGHTTSHIVNILGNVRSVSYYGGATAVEMRRSWWIGVSLGSFIIGETGLIANPNNKLFQHEYGHYLQSQASGWFYFSKYGIPSALSHRPHSLHPVEQDANIRALIYFNKHVNSYSGWNFLYNPITGYNQTLPFNDPANQNALRIGRLQLSWYDYLLGPNIILSGLINSLILNSQY